MKIFKLILQHWQVEKLKENFSKTLFQIEQKTIFFLQETQ